MIAKDHDLPIKRQAELLDISRSSVYLGILVIPIIGTGFIRSPDFPNATGPMVSL